jgi:hypothetical protein
MLFLLVNAMMPPYHDHFMPATMCKLLTAGEQSDRKECGNGWIACYTL